MDPLELKLKRALEPKEPPAGFAERALARALEKAAGAERPQPEAEGRRAPLQWALGWFFRPAWRAALAGGLACLLLLGGLQAYRQRQEKLRGEKAAAEVLLALQIASSKLNRVRYVLAPEDGRSREGREKGRYESQN